jgi:hypothetical protein
VLGWREGGRLSIGQERGGGVDLGEIEIEIDIVHVCEVVIGACTLRARRTPEANRSAAMAAQILSMAFTSYTRTEHHDEKRPA